MIQRSTVISKITWGWAGKKGAGRIAVGTAIAGRPPHRSVRAELLHTALTLDGDALRNARWDRDEVSAVSVASVCKVL